MSIYINTGKLGSGKTLLAVSRIRDALKSGRRVATNLDLHLEHMLPARWGAPGKVVPSVVRIPDKPTVADLESLGQGSDILDESDYGLLVLDELGSWLNSRDWSDKGRPAVIDWLIHSRKKRWDVIFIVQHINMIDKQIRESLVEYAVTCKRLDKVRIPFFGRLGWLLTFGMWDGRVGKIHLGVVVYVAGSSPNSPLVVDRWLYRGTDLYKAYDTEQIFTSAEAAPFCYVPPWHTVGRFLPPVRSWFQVVLDAVAPVGRRHSSVPLKPKLRAVQMLMKLPPDKRMRAAARMMLRADGVAVSPFF